MNPAQKKTSEVLIGKDQPLPVGLTMEDLLTAYSEIVLIRVLDERLWLLNRQGKAALVASCQGHEGTQLGSVWAFRNNVPDYTLFTYYRHQGVAIASGVTPTECLYSFLGKDGDIFSGARQFPLHGISLKHKIMNQSNVVATQMPHAVGCALAYKMRSEDAVAGVYFGDGAASQGDCHEAMNFASVQKLPVLFMCENNRYAISVPQSKQMNVANVADRAEGYGMPGLVVDGTDFLDVYTKTSNAVRRIREGGGPMLLEYKVERYLPHTSDDDDRRYRSKEEMEESKLRDPVTRLQRWLQEAGVLTKEMDAAYWAHARKEINRATEEAEQAEYPDTGGFFDHVYADNH
jgi:2-oxoisovalerate dehydrogenase E1 component alpha subunit